nr:effector protein Pi02860 [Phytophthora infestans]
MRLAFLLLAVSHFICGNALPTNVKSSPVVSPGLIQSFDNAQKPVVMSRKLLRTDERLSEANEERTKLSELFRLDDDEVAVIKELSSMFSAFLQKKSQAFDVYDEIFRSGYPIDTAARISNLYTKYLKDPQAFRGP